MAVAHLVAPVDSKPTPLAVIDVLGSAGRQVAVQRFRPRLRPISEPMHHRDGRSLHFSSGVDASAALAKATNRPDSKTTCPGTSRLWCADDVIDARRSVVAVARVVRRLPKILRKVSLVTLRYDVGHWQSHGGDKPIRAEHAGNPNNGGSMSQEVSCSDVYAEVPSKRRPRQVPGLAGLLFATLLLGSCGGGSAPAQVESQPSPPSAAALAPVPMQFGTNNRIDLIAGSAVVSVPVTANDDVTNMTLRMVEGPPFATIEGMALKIDVTAHPQEAKSYGVTLTLVDGNQKERGRQVGAIGVSAVSIATKELSLVNGGSVAFEPLGVTISAPSEAFTSGTAQVKLERILETDGTAALRISTSEPINVPLRISSLIVGTGRASIQSARKSATGARISTMSTCNNGEARGLFSPSISKVCARVWSQATSTVSCRFGSDTAVTTPQQSGWERRVSPDEVPATQLACSGRPSVIINADRVWSKLSAPDNWDSSTFDWSKKTPFILIHGFTPFELGGSSDTWADTGQLLEALTLPDGTRPVVFEFQWRTNTSYEDVAREFLEAVDLIYAQSGTNGAQSKKITVIAHSFGGLVARVAIQVVSKNAGKPANQIDRLITIGTPHSGVASVAEALKSKVAGPEFPAGSDFPVNFLCWQLSCREAGTSVDLPDPWKDEPGDIILKINDTLNYPLPSGLNVNVLIGLRRDSFSANPITYVQRNGDGLISYLGQRFWLRDSLAGSPLRSISSPANQSNGGALIEEHVLGLIGGQEPNFDVSFPSNSKASFWDVRHSSSFFTGITADWSEPYIESSKSDKHPTWAELHRILVGSGQSVSPSTQDPLGKPATPLTSGFGDTTSPGPTTGVDVTLSWDSVGTASYYRVNLQDLSAASSVNIPTTTAASVSASLQPGRYYSWYVTACNRVSCSNDSAPRYFRTVAGAFSDLVVDGVTITPALVISGDRVRVSWSLKNQGNSPAAPSTSSVRINQSDTEPVPSDETSTASAAQIQPGERVTQTALLSAPAVLGSYRIWVVADRDGTAGQGTARRNDGARAAGALVVQAPGPVADLMPQNMHVAPNPAIAGGSVIVTYDVVNAGGAAAPASQTKIQIKDSAGVVLTQQLFATAAIAANSSVTESRSMSLAGAATGSYNAFVIVDNLRAVTQSNTSNDLSAGTPFTVQGAATSLADLVPQSISVTPNPATSGGTVTVNYTVANTGGTAAPASQTRIQIKNSAGTLLLQTDFATAAIAANSSVTESRSMSLAGAATGSYNAFVIVDNTSVVPQTNTTNDLSAGTNFSVR